MTTSGSDRSFDVVVIGSGMGGLAAALTCVRGGKKTLVLEAGKQYGGYTNPFKRGKYTFDPGLHYIGECAPGAQMSRLIASLGLDAEVRFRELSPDGFDRLVFPGYEIKTPRGADVYRDRLAHDFPREKEGLDRFFALLAEFREAIRALSKLPAALSGWPSPTDLLRAASHVPFLARYVRATFADILGACFKDPLLKAVLAAQSGDYGLPPSRAAAFIGLGLLDHYLGGAYFPIGGSRKLRDAFVDAIKKGGGELKRNARVNRILVERGEVRGVQVAGDGEYAATRVVSNADAVVTYRDLVGPDHLPSRFLGKVDRVKHSVASVCMFIGTDLDVGALGMTDANIWHYPTTDIESVYAILERGDLPRDDFFFLSSPTLKDPDCTDKAPPGHHTVEFVTLAPFAPFARWQGTKTQKRGEAYDVYKQHLESRYLGAVERYIPGIKGHLLVCETATPVTNITYAAAPFGAIYGPEATPDQMGPWRFGVKSPVKGLYLCGASTLGAGIVPAALSGKQAGKMAIKGA